VKGGVSMLDFTWKVFVQTGNIDTYLLFKELENEKKEIPDNLDDELAQIDFPVS
jgi:Icc-related predicted phosphoesterase